MINDFSGFLLEVFGDCKNQQIDISFVCSLDKRLSLVRLDHSLTKPDCFLPKVNRAPLISRQMGKDSDDLAYFIFSSDLTIKFLIQFELREHSFFYVAHNFQIVHPILVEGDNKPTDCPERMREELMKGFGQAE